MEKETEYNKIIEALNVIDEQANGEYITDDPYKEERRREKAYNMVANFIDKKAKH